MATILPSISSLSLLTAPSAPKLNPMRRHGRLQLGSWRTGPSLTVRAVPPSSQQLPSPSLHSAVDHHVRGEEEEEEQMQHLISVVRNELADDAASIDGDQRLGTDAATIMETLKLVDLIQRLGICRFFEPEIRTILNKTFRLWVEKRGLGDGESTVLAFRLLRLDGFHVSPDVIENLKDESTGELSSFSVETPEKLSGMIDLYKCSQVGFPIESKIMGEAKDFSVKQLRIALSEGAPSVLQHDNLEREVRFALEYPRRFLLWRLESRSVIKQLWPSAGIKNKCLHLAWIDLEMLQRIHKKEADELMRWWVDSGFSELEFTRDSVFECFLSISATAFEPQFAASRAAFTKTAVLVTVLDDLFDHYSELDSLVRFVEAFRRWDASLLDDLPDHRVIFKAVQRCVVEQAEDSSEAQGRELFPFFKALWEDILDVFAKEAEWRITEQVPGWNEYIENAKVSIGGIAYVWTSMFLMGEMISDCVLKHLGKDSRFMHLASLVARLSNDLGTFEREARCGELASSVSSYLKENPGHSQEEAVAALQSLIESACRELELELFASRGRVPECCSRLLLGIARTSAFIYKRADAFSEAALDKEYEAITRDYMFGSFL